MLCVTLVTDTDDKIYRISYSKRCRRDDTTSDQFGFKYIRCAARASFRLGRCVRMLDSNIRLPVLLRALRDRASRHFAYAFYRNSALSVPKTVLREEFYGVSLNGNLFPQEIWTLEISTSFITKGCQWFL